MDGMMDVWNDEWMDGCTGRWMYGWNVDGCIELCMYV